MERRRTKLLAISLLAAGWLLVMMALVSGAEVKSNSSQANAASNGVSRGPVALTDSTRPHRSGA